MSFKLYFAGQQPKFSEELLENQENYRLFSYFLDKKLIQRRIDKNLPTFIDSGAYSAHTRKIEVDVDDYINYLNERDEFVSIAAQLDTIPGEFGKPKTQEQIAEAPKQSWENYLYMIERVKSPEKILPIFHQGEDFKYLEQMLEYKPKIEYMGISPANDLSVKAKEPWIMKCFEVIKKSSNPNIKTHAFGMTSLHLLEQYPFHSADSTSWLMTSANGGIMSKYGVLLVSEQGKGKKNYIGNLPKSVQKEISDYVESFGHTLEQLATDYKSRSNHNILYLTEWAKNYKYQPKSMKQSTLF